MKEVITEDMNVDVVKMGSSVVTSAGRTDLNIPAPVFLPEGRVHGGSLMAMLTGSSGIGSSSSKGVVSASSEPTKTYMMPWM